MVFVSNTEIVPKLKGVGFDAPELRDIKHRWTPRILGGIRRVCLHYTRPCVTRARNVPSFTALLNSSPQTTQLASLGNIPSLILCLK